MNPPPLFVSYGSAEEYVKALANPSNECVAKVKFLADSRLPVVTGERELAVLFGYSSSMLYAVTKRPSRYYRRFVIECRGKKRTICAPRVVLKCIQSWIGHHLSRAVELNPSVHGFVPGKSTISAAASHIGSTWLTSVDIEDFFPSIGGMRVRAALETIGFDADSAKLICRLCTLEDSLPQGSPASPVLANLAFAKIDESIADYCRNASVKYSRYADDLLFSSNSGRPADLVQNIAAILRQQGFNLSKKKTHHSDAPNPLRALGLSIIGEKIQLSRSYRKVIKTYRFIIQKRASEIPDHDRHVLLGHIAYAEAVERFQSDSAN